MERAKTMTTTETDIEKDIQILLPFARKRVDSLGLSHTAGDDGIVALAYARANAECKAPGWCECPPGENEEFYFCAQSGTHGWMCGKCRKITQQG